MYRKATSRNPLAVTYLILAVTSCTNLNLNIPLSSARRFSSILCAVRSSQANSLIIRMTVTAVKLRQSAVREAGLLSVRTLRNLLNASV